MIALITNEWQMLSTHSRLSWCRNRGVHRYILASVQFDSPSLTFGSILSMPSFQIWIRWKYPFGARAYIILNRIWKETWFIMDIFALNWIQSNQTSMRINFLKAMVLLCKTKECQYFHSVMIYPFTQFCLHPNYYFDFKKLL